MNLSRYLARGAVAASLLVASLSVSSSLAQAPSLPDNVRTAADAGPHRQQITDFVAAQVARLNSGQPADIAAAREALVNAVSGQPSISFNELYADAVNTALTPLAKSPDVALRLNLAIASARIAERTGSVRVAPLIKALLADESAGVALWAMKASRPLVLKLLADPILATNSLAQPIVASAKKHLSSGPVAAEAYAALTSGLLDRTARASYSSAQLQRLVPAIVDAVQEIALARVKLYEQGVPPDPSIDGPRAMLFMLDTQNWALKSDAQKARTAELLLWIGQLAAQRQAQDVPNRNELVEVVRFQGRSLVQLADFVSSAALRSAADDMSRVTPFTGAAQVLATTTDIAEALKSVPLFKSVPVPPTVSAGPTTSSAPATGG
jgi:hypothetical protein